MMRAVKWTRGLLFQNLGWKLLSLAASVAIWGLVASEPELSTFVTVPVEYKNLPNQLEIASNPVTSVQLELQGPAGELQDAGGAGIRPQVIFDMALAAPGERTFSIGSGSVTLPRGVRLVRAMPSQARFEFERRSIRTVPVRARTAGDGQQGYFVAGEVITPPALQIVGPASHVARVTEALTDAIDLTGVVGSKEFRVNATVGDPLVRFVVQPQVNVSVTMKKR